MLAQMSAKPRPPARTFAFGRGFPTRSLDFCRASDFRVLATGIFERGVATQRQDPKVQPTTAELKEEVAKLIDKEIAESTAATSFCQDYLRQNNFQLSADVNGLVTLTRTKGRHSIKIRFDPRDGERKEESRSEEDGSGEEESDEEKDGIAEERVAELEIPLLVGISVSDKTNKEISRLALTCVAEKDKLFVDAVHGSDEQRSLEFDLLSEPLQWKLHEFLESLGLNNEFGKFVIEYVSHHLTHNSIDVLKDVKAFMEAME